MKWQPIDTAPKELDSDGLSPRVLLGIDAPGGLYATEGFWSYGGEWGNGTKCGPGWVSCSDPDVPTPYLEPHVWAKLPIPPRNTNQ